MNCHDVNARGNRQYSDANRPFIRTVASSREYDMENEIDSPVMTILEPPPQPSPIDLNQIDEMQKELFKSSSSALAEIYALGSIDNVAMYNLPTVSGIPLAHIILESQRRNPGPEEAAELSVLLPRLEQVITPSWDSIVSFTIAVCKHFVQNVDTLLNSLECIKFCCLHALLYTESSKSSGVDVEDNIVVTELEILVAVLLSSKVCEHSTVCIHACTVSLFSLCLHIT